MKKKAEKLTDKMLEEQMVSKLYLDILERNECLHLKTFLPSHKQEKAYLRVTVCF